jgi:UDP-glucose 4-epimerase
VPYTLGAGGGYSVLEVVHAFEKVTGRPLPYEIIERRPGDTSAVFCSRQRALNELPGWAEACGGVGGGRDILQACRDFVNYIERARERVEAAAALKDAPTATATVPADRANRGRLR